VERTHEKIKQAKLIIYLVDPEQDVKEIVEQITYLKELDIPFLIVVNKKDLVSAEFEGELSVVSYQLSELRQQTTDNKQQTTDNRQQTTDNRQQTTDNRQQTTDNRQQTTDNRQQTTDNILYISAKNKTGIEELKSEILRKVNLHSINTDDVLVSNIRHLEALQKTEESLNRVLVNIDNPITSDFLASDIKQALYYLGEITGQVTTDDLLETIFSKFCIGK
jgi:tRNA modification GTPase